MYIVHNITITNNLRIMYLSCMYQILYTYIIYRFLYVYNMTCPCVYNVIYLRPVHCVRVAVVKTRDPTPACVGGWRHLADGPPETLAAAVLARLLRRSLSPSSLHVIIFFGSVASVRSSCRRSIATKINDDWQVARPNRGGRFDRGFLNVFRVAVRGRVISPVTVVRGKSMFPRHFPPSRPSRRRLRERPCTSLTPLPRTTATTTTVRPQYRSGVSRVKFYDFHTIYRVNGCYTFTYIILYQVYIYIL